MTIHITDKGRKPMADDIDPAILADIAELLVRLDRPHTPRRKPRLTWTGHKGHGRR